MGCDDFGDDISNTMRGWLGMDDLDDDEEDKAPSTGFSYEDYMTGVVAQANPTEFEEQEPDKKRKSKGKRRGMVRRDEDLGLLMLAQGGKLGTTFRTVNNNKGVYG